MWDYIYCRSPHGECGLKLTSVHNYAGALPSLPAWGVWIEIRVFGKEHNSEGGRSPHGECGLKSVIFFGISNILLSLPAWGVWIEIATCSTYFVPSGVAPRMGSVD